MNKTAVIRLINRSRSTNVIAISETGEVQIMTSSYAYGPEWFFLTDPISFSHLENDEQMEYFSNLLAFHLANK